MRFERILAAFAHSDRNPRLKTVTAQPMLCCDGLNQAIGAPRDAVAHSRDGRTNPLDPDFRLRSFSRWIRAKRFSLEKIWRGGPEKPQARSAELDRRDDEIVPIRQAQPERSDDRGLAIIWRR